MDAPLPNGEILQIPDGEPWALRQSTGGIDFENPALSVQPPAQFRAHCAGHQAHGDTRMKILIGHAAPKFGEPAARSKQSKNLEPGMVQVRRQHEWTLPRGRLQLDEHIAKFIAAEIQAMFSAELFDLAPHRVLVVRSGGAAQEATGERRKTPNC